MKRIGLIKRIKKLGARLVRHGSKHDWYENVTTGAVQAVPRHREVDEDLARNIIKKLGSQSEE